MKDWSVSKSNVFLGVALVASLGLNVFLYVARVSQLVQIEFARDIVDIVLTTARQRSGDQEAAEYMRTYYPAGSKLAEGSKLSKLVEDVRAYAMDQVEDAKPSD